MSSNVEPRWAVDLAGDEFKTYGLSDGILAGVRLEIAYDDIDALRLSSCASVSIWYVLPTPAA